MANGVLEDHLTITGKMRAIVDGCPEALFAMQGTRRVTFQEMDLRTNALAHAMIEHGIGRQDRVALMGYNSIEWMEAFMAANKIACIPCNVNYRYMEKELIYLIDNMEASWAFVDAELAGRLKHVMPELPSLKHVVVMRGRPSAKDTPPGALFYDDILRDYPSTSPKTPYPPCNNDDLYFLLYTGGTTGMPKGAMWDRGLFEGAPGLYAPTVENIVGRLDRVPEVFFKPRDPSKKPGPVLRVLSSDLGIKVIRSRPLKKVLVKGIQWMVEQRNVGELSHTERAGRLLGGKFPLLVTCPLMHGTGLFSALQSTTSGQTLILLENNHFDPKEFWDVVERDKPRVAVVVGDAFAQPIVDEMEQGGRDGRYLSIMLSSGVTWTPSVKRRLLEKMPQLIILDTLGATEGLSRSAVSMSSDDDIAMTRFKMTPVMKLFDSDMKEIHWGSGRIGMLGVAGMIPRGYWRDPEKSERTFKEHRGVRYAVFGDMGTVEADGTMVLIGRGSSCINSAGEKIYPEEIQDLINEHPAVYDCCVLGVPDPRWNEAVTALAVLKKGHKLSEAELVDWCRGKIADYKKPKHVLFVDTLNRAPNGKLDYKALKERALGLLGIRSA